MFEVGRSSYNVASNFIRSCYKLRRLTKFSSEVRACPKLVRSLPDVRAKLVHSWPEVRPKLARSSSEVGPKFVRSWPEVRAKLARSSCEVGAQLARSSSEVGPKFVRSWPEVRPKLVRSSCEVGPKFCSEVRFEVETYFLRLPYVQRAMHVCSYISYAMFAMPSTLPYLLCNCASRHCPFIGHTDCCTALHVTARFYVTCCYKTRSWLMESTKYACVIICKESEYTYPPSPLPPAFDFIYCSIMQHLVNLKVFLCSEHYLIIAVLS